MVFDVQSTPHSRCHRGSGATSTSSSKSARKGVLTCEDDACKRKHKKSPSDVFDVHTRARDAEYGVWSSTLG